MAGHAPAPPSRWVAGAPAPDALEHALGAAVFSFSLAVYMRTAYPDAAGGDSGELVVVANDLGVPHPPGYPTITLLTWAAAKLASIVSPATAPVVAMNTFHNFLGALANTFLFYATSRWTGVAGAGVLAAGVFGFSPTVWLFSTHPEVFSLNNLLINLLLLVLVLFANARGVPKARGAGVADAATATAALCEEADARAKRIQSGAPQPKAAKGSPVSGSNEDDSGSRLRLRYALVGAFVCGLCLSNQHTTVLYVMFVVAWVFFAEFNEMYTWRRCLALLCALAAGAAPYVWLPISTKYYPSANTWGYFDSVHAFLVHLLRVEYGTFKLGSGDAFGAAAVGATGLTYYAGDMNSATHYLWLLAFPALGVVSAKGLIREVYPSVDTLLASMLAFYLTFWFTHANLDVSRNPLHMSVQQRFWMQPLSIIAMFIGRALAAGAGFVAGGHSRPLARGITVLAGAAVCVLQVTAFYERIDRSEVHIMRDYGRAVLDALPENALLISEGDTLVCPVRYAITMENRRPDVAHFDALLATYDWYFRNYERVYPPGHGRHLNLPKVELLKYSRRPEACIQHLCLADLAAANPERRIFVMSDWSAPEGWAQQPSGLVVEIFPPGAVPTGENPARKLCTTPACWVPLGDQFAHLRETYPLPRFPPARSVSPVEWAWEVLTTVKLLEQASLAVMRQHSMCAVVQPPDNGDREELLKYASCLVAVNSAAMWYLDVYKASLRDIYLRPANRVWFAGEQTITICLEGLLNVLLAEQAAHIAGVTVPQINFHALQVEAAELFVELTDAYPTVTSDRIIQGRAQLPHALKSWKGDAPK